MKYQVCMRYQMCMMHGVYMLAVYMLAVNTLAHRREGRGTRMEMLNLDKRGASTWSYSYLPPGALLTS